MDTKQFYYQHPHGSNPITRKNQGIPFPIQESQQGADLYLEILPNHLISSAQLEWLDNNSNKTASGALRRTPPDLSRTQSAGMPPAGEKRCQCQAEEAPRRRERSRRVNGRPDPAECPTCQKRLAATKRLPSGAVCPRLEPPLLCEGVRGNSRPL